MENNPEEYAKNTNGLKNFLIGLLLGGLTGAAALLLFAPQSGKRTRSQIQNNAIELPDQTTRNIKEHEIQ